MDLQGASPSTISFYSPDLLDWLEAASSQEIEALNFGVVAFDSDETCVIYNRDESERSGLLPERVIGLRFFAEVAPCTNNYLVAERYRTEPVLDAELDYVFTLRMKPTPVRLRLLSSPESKLRYMVVIDAPDPDPAGQVQAL